MMTVMTQLVVWLNGLANACAWVLLAPIAVLPGWLSATLVAAVTGVLMLLVFKYTSNQKAVRRVRNGIKANLLALSLFRDSMVVGFRSQGRIVMGAGRLLSLAVVPMLVMLIPMCLLLSQLAVWYQARPLHLGEEAVVTVHLADCPEGELPDVQLAPCSAIALTVGPVRVPRKQMICWNVRACEAGYHRLMFAMNGQTFEKELAAGDGFMRVSPQRPAWCWSDAVRYPCETPFAADSIVQAIELAYPARESWTAGSNSWLVYWCAASMVFALLMRPLLNVNL
jgi:hypothetical protein